MIADEKTRQESVRRYGLAGTDPPGAPDAELTALAVRARRLMGAEHAAVNILDEDGAVLIAGSAGVPLGRLPRTDTVCHRVAAAFPGRRFFLTSDPANAPLVADHPQVTGELATISFYAGVPLIGIEGRPVGVVCAWSDGSVPSPEPKIEMLETVGRAVMAVLDARRRIDEVPPGSGASDPGPVKGVGATLSPQLSIHAVIDEQLVRTLFQPIVEIETRTVVGFEALSRGPEDTALETPMAMLDAARSVGRLGELDWLCRVLAMEAASAADLPPGLSWFINVEPAGVSEECPDHLLPALRHARSDLRVVLEIVERDLNGHVTHLLHAADQARRDVWGVALDDVGSQKSSLALLPLLKPDVVKLDMSLVQGGPNRRAAAVTATVRAYAERTGAVVLAEGIETEEHERLARVYGATYAQGYLYGRPGVLPTHLAAPRSVVPLQQHLDALDGATPFEVASRAARPERATKDLLLHLSHHLEDRCAQLSEPFVLLAAFEDVRFLSDRLRERYRSLSTHSALTVVQVPGAVPEQSPTFQLTSPLPGSRAAGQWVVLALSAGFAGAFVAQDCGDQGPDSRRRLDFVHTYDPGVVTAIARSFLQQLVPADALYALPDPTQPDPGVPEQTRGGAKSFLSRYVKRG